MTLEFEWDEAKAEANLKKHGIRFELATQIFNGPVYSFVDDREDYGEAREISIGEVNGQIVLVVVHTDRDGVIRIISARRAKRQERQIYYEYSAQEDE